MSRERDVDPWTLLEGSNGTFLISNMAGLNPPISIDFGRSDTKKKVAERDAWAIVEALNVRDSALRANPAAAPEAGKTPDWEKVADSLLSHGGSISKVDPTASSVLMFLSYALRDGLDAATLSTRNSESCLPVKKARFHMKIRLAIIFKQKRKYAASLRASRSRHKNESVGLLATCNR
jgi:hypothetical protein